MTLDPTEPIIHLKQTALTKTILDGTPTALVDDPVALVNDPSVLTGSQTTPAPDIRAHASSNQPKGVITRRR